MSEKSKIYAYYLIETDEKNIVHTWAECQSKVKGKKARKNWKLNSKIG